MSSPEPVETDYEDVPGPLLKMIADYAHPDGPLEVPLYPVIGGLRSLVRVDVGVLLGELSYAVQFTSSAPRFHVLSWLQRLARETEAAAVALRRDMQLPYADVFGHLTVIDDENREPRRPAPPAGTAPFSGAAAALYSEALADASPLGSVRRPEVGLEDLIKFLDGQILRIRTNTEDGQVLADVAVVGLEVCIQRIREFLGQHKAAPQHVPETLAFAMALLRIAAAAPMAYTDADALIVYYEEAKGYLVDLGIRGYFGRI